MSVTLQLNRIGQELDFPFPEGRAGFICRQSKQLLLYWDLRSTKILSLFSEAEVHISSSEYSQLQKERILEAS